MKTEITQETWYHYPLIRSKLPLMHWTEADRDLAQKRALRKLKKESNAAPHPDSYAR